MERSSELDEKMRKGAPGKGNRKGRDLGAGTKLVH